MSKQRLIQKSQLKVTPQQIQFLNLLQTPLVSIDRIIEKELDERVNTSNIFLQGCFYELSNRLRKLKNNYKPLTGE